MLQRFLKCISTLLVLVMLVNMVPVQALENLSAETSAAAAAEIAPVTEDGKIVAELSHDRDAYTKQFLLDNGNKLAVQYAIPVHYQDSNGTWQQYDNRMTQTEAAAAEATATDNAEVEYRVIRSDKDIRLAKKASEKKLVTIEKDGHQISWGFSDIHKVDVAFTEEDTVYEGNEAYLTLEGIIQEARYDDAFPNADLQYYILPTGVKENIILKNADAQNEFQMEYKFHNLTAAQTDSRHITLSDEAGKPVYTITAPAMCDANGVWSNALTLTIVEAKENKLTVKLSADAQWLQAEERSFPVTVDPSFSTDKSWDSVSSTTLVSGYPDRAYGYGSNNYIGSLYVGYETSSTFRKTRALVKINELPQLSPGDVIVDAKIWLRQQASSSSIQVNAHKITESWEMATATWTSMNENFDPSVEDYNMTYSGTSTMYNSWNVTDLVRKWYDGTEENYGVMLIAPTENSTTRSRVIYYASTYPGSMATKPALEITYRNHNGLESYWDYTASSAGRAGTGYVNSYTGNLVWTKTDMSFGGNLGAVAISHIYNANDTQENLFGMGCGWRTNYNQRVYNWSKDSSYYIWEDEDGTDHYFKKVSSGTYKDEDNLDLTLTNTGSGNEKFVIENKIGGKSYFDTNGRLTKISNNQKTVTDVHISYISSDSLQISTVTDGVDRVYAFTYTDGLLSRLSFKGNGTTELTYTAYGYTNNLLTSITHKDGETVSYTYDPDYKFLTEAQDVDGYKITYEYTHFSQGKPSRITKVQEFDGTTSGGKLTISYGHNETTFVDIKGNKQILQFNNWGNTVSVQDGEGRAQFAEYAQDTDSSGKGNQLHLASKMQNTVVNLLADSSFENGTLWTPAAGAVCSISTEEHYMGSKSLRVFGGNAIAQTLTVKAGQTYAFSGYFKVVSGEARIAMVVIDGQGINSNKLISICDWTRYQISYTNNTSADQSVYVMIRGTEETYLDCVQLELQPTASRYNLVNNGDFTANTGWTPTNAETGDGITTAADSAPTLDSKVYAVSGNALQQKSISQEVQVSGAEGDSFVLGGWAMGDAAPIPEGSDRAFSLYAIFHYTDETTSERMSASFNPDADGWQYTATGLVAEKDYSSVTVYACYDYGVNTVYFDGLQLFKEEFGASYTYDDDGNVISVIDLQNKKTEYEYDTDGNLTQIIEDGNVEMTYTYDSWHNVQTATTKEGYVYSFTYDDYGNNTSVSITENTESEVKKTMTSSAAYTENGDFLVSATDALGNVTRYGYNDQTGVLEWVQYPEDTEATRTEYTYDAMYRTAAVATTTDTNLNLSVNYTYEDDLLTKIQTPTTAYTFSYGVFSLRESVKIGERVLASYTYEDLTNRLKKLDFGNGNVVQYAYDSQGRLLTETYEDGETVSYAYDNSGNLATVTDSETGVVTTYYYDLLNRGVGYREQGQGLDHSVTYTYDAENNLSSMTEVINGTSKTYSYTYNDDNRLTSMTVDGVTVEYAYDTFGRLATQTTKQGNTVILTEQTGYNDTDTTASTQVTSHNGFTYTYDDNGNILSVSDGTNTTSYVYDSQNQLIRENNQAKGFTHTWTYDNAGNILTRKEYAYTTVENLQNVTPTDTVNYGYGDTAWGDLLTSYDGRTITYDEIGNPLSDGEWTYTWKHGRQLESMSKGSITWNFTYNADGLRTKRTNGTATYTYVYNGSQLVMMTVGENTLHFTYDATGIPLAVKYNGTTYYYKTNLQGDVMAIADSTGAVVVAYTYDAWGMLLYISGAMRDTLGTVNPLTYRGYVYDRDTGLYYLQSRYYDPEMGRFINGDVFATTGQGFTGNNMFAYCGNNPIKYKDSAGTYLMMVIPFTFPFIIKYLKNLSDENYEQNSAVDSNPKTTTQNKIINDQNGATGQNFVYGAHSASWNACEVIAVHNLNVLLNRDSSLSETIKAFQDAGAMIGDGYFGSNPHAIGGVLKSQGIMYQEVGLEQMNLSGFYIISYWNDGAPWNGLHTVAVSYDGKKYTTYNLACNGTISNKNPAEYASNFICGYYIGKVTV